MAKNSSKSALTENLIFLVLFYFKFLILEKQANKQ